MTVISEGSVGSDASRPAMDVGRWMHALGQDGDAGSADGVMHALLAGMQQAAKVLPHGRVGMMQSDTAPAAQLQLRPSAAGSGGLTPIRE